MIALKPGMRRVRNLSSARPVRRGDCACAQFCCRGIGNGDSSHRRLRLSKFSPPGPFFIRACALISKRAWRWCTSERKRGFEFERAGWFFIYNNHHWILNPPGRLTEDSRTGGSGFKCGGEQRNEGGIYVFNNSWLFQGTERLFRKGAIGRLRHYNNAIKTLPNFNGRFFGKNWNARDDFDVTPEQLAKAESNRFTRRWNQMGIEMNGDWICDNNSVESYRQAGYALGSGTRDKDPGYDGPVDSRL